MGDPAPHSMIRERGPIMAEPLSAHIMRQIPQAMYMYHRLVLLVAPLGAGVVSWDHRSGVDRRCRVVCRPCDSSHWSSRRTPCRAPTWPLAPGASLPATGCAGLARPLAASARSLGPPPSACGVGARARRPAPHDAAPPWASPNSPRPPRPRASSLWRQAGVCGGPLAASQGPQSRERGGGGGRGARPRGAPRRAYTACGPRPWTAPRQGAAGSRRALAPTRRRGPARGGSIPQ
jgi:hypothetical protein